MPLHTAEALVLRTYPLGEADRIVVFLTRDRGKRRGVARGARRSRARFGGALEPLTRVGVAYFERERRDLVSLNYAEAERSPLECPNPSAGLYASYFAELIDEAAPEHDADETLFRLGAATLEAMAGGAPLGPLARYVEFWILRLQGVYPPCRACARCGRDLREAAGGGAALALVDGAFLCRRCFDAARPRIATAGPMLSPAAMRFLAAAAAVGPERVGALEFEAEAARELERLHRSLLTAHFEREPRSVRVLKDLDSWPMG